MIEAILGVEFAVAFAVGLLGNRASWRILMWLVFPGIVALVVAGPPVLEGNGWALLSFVPLLGGGFIAAGLGSLSGYYVRRMPPPK